MAFMSLEFNLHHLTRCNILCAAAAASRLQHTFVTYSDDTFVCSSTHTQVSDCNCVYYD